MFTKKILAAAITPQPSANGVADAIDFDGTNDFLWRGSDLVGNVDGKTFTFSAWVWVNNDAETSAIYNSRLSSSGEELFSVVYSGIGGWAFTAKNSASIVVYNKSLSNVWPKQGWNHLLLSIDLTNSLNHYVFINDIQQAGGFTTYTNDIIDFTNAYHSVGAGTFATNKCKGRISNVFLDYTYRDLSIEANRRLFITADRKPTPKATLQALNPILYLPLDDPTQAGKNLGTGGDFKLSGVVARSGRGPNQFNAAYSDLDGSTDYLSRTSALTGIADGKQFTFACCFNADSISSNAIVLAVGSTTDVYFQADIYYAAGNDRYVRVIGRNAAGSNVFNVRTPLIEFSRNYTLVVSADLTDTNKRHVFLNGSSAAHTWTTYTNATVAFSQASPKHTVGSNINSSQYFNGRLGNVFFDTRYIDLSVPANLAKFVTGAGIDAKPADLGANGEKPFGTAPLIYLPMYGNNAGKNYGTGGDFTANGGPYPGARGPNEYWGNKARFSASTDFLERTSSLAGISNGKAFSLSFFCRFDDSTNQKDIFYIMSGGNPTLLVRRQNTGSISILLRDPLGNVVLNTDSTVVVQSNADYLVQICFDATNKKGYVYINGVGRDFSAEVSASDISFNGSIQRFSKPYTGTAFTGNLSEFYFTTEYINFSQEANRLKFRDAFGNPVDLRPQIAAGTLPNPVIYMRLDPANFGKNDGTGGDFVVNGTITDGGQL